MKTNSHDKHTKKPQRHILSTLQNDFDRSMTKIDKAEIELAETEGIGECHFVESKTKFVMKLALPRIAKKDVKIEVHGKRLKLVVKHHEEKMIKGAKSESEKESESYIRRSFLLPAAVETKTVRSQLENGILTVDLPKVRSAKDMAPGKSGIHL